MLRFQCPLCRGIIALDAWEPSTPVTCACCGKEVKAPESRFAPGTIIGDFLLVKKLGAGGMGIVYKAHQLSLDRPAAIKILNPEYSKEAESVQGFIREARSAAKLNHPNIVQAYAVGEDEGVFYFAMEFINGRTMKEVLEEKGKLDSTEAARVIMQIADGLDTAWTEQKLIHHDIKPDNIMQCGKDKVKLSDLGLSQVFGEDADDDSDEVLGTPQYISPEQLTGVVTDTRSDIYSLGATFYHFVTGQFPYNGKDTDEIARQHVYGTLKPPREVNPMLPQPLNDIIVKMMAKDPEKRYQSCKEIVQALKNYLNPPASGMGGAKLNAMGGGSSSGGKTLTLNSNNAKPLVVAPLHANTNKLSMKAPLEENKKENTAAQPEKAKITMSTDNANQAEPAKNEAKPVIKLNLPAAAAPAAPTPAPVPAAPPPAPAASSSQIGPGGVVSSATNSLTGQTAGITPPKPGKKAKKAKKEPEPVEETEQLEEEEEKGPSTNKLTLIILGALIVFGGLAYLLFGTNGKAVPIPDTPTTPEPVAMEPVVAQPEPEPVVVVPAVVVQPKKPDLSPVMQELVALRDLSLEEPQKFLQEFPGRIAAVKPETDEEKTIIANLEISYIDLDERLNVTVAREPLLKQYRQNNEDKVTADEHAKLYAAASVLDQEAERLANASDEAYAADLPRKMMLLDYAMLHATRSGKAEDWKKFQQTMRDTQKEVEANAANSKRLKFAQFLAQYAEMLLLSAEQGRDFTRLLQSNQLANRSLRLGNEILTVKKTDTTQLEYSTEPAPDAEEAPEPREGTIKFLEDTPTLVRSMLDSIGKAMGRSDQYFYFMLYNCNLEKDLSFAAPDKFWAQRINQIAEGYFRREWQLSTDKEKEALKQKYQDWASFKRAVPAL